MATTMQVRYKVVKASDVHLCTICGRFGGLTACMLAQQEGKKFFLFNGKLFQTPELTAGITGEGCWFQYCYPFYRIQP
jgi:hypothetical protein